jgi:hypothetical protein
MRETKLKEEELTLLNLRFITENEDNLKLHFVKNDRILKLFSKPFSEEERKFIYD